MLVKISSIIIGPDRPPADPAHVRKIANSLDVVGILSSITVSDDLHLIAGLHRLEAAKMLGWTEIECVIQPLHGLEAELAELDEDVVRKDISGVTFGEKLLRRKEVYETLYPETREGTAQANGMNRALGRRVKDDLPPDALEGTWVDRMPAVSKPDIPGCRIGDGSVDKMSATLNAVSHTRLEAPIDKMTGKIKSFVDDTAEKMNVTPRTVRRQLQAARNLNAEARNIIKAANVKISKKGTMELSRLEPEQQKEAASMLAAGEVKTVEEYEKRIAGVEDAERKLGENAPETGDEKSRQKKGAEPNPDPPFRLDGRRYATFEESAADLKNVDKEVRCTPDIFLAEFTATIDRMRRDIACYRENGYQEAYPELSGIQFQYLQGKVNELRSDLTSLLNLVKGMKRA